MSEVPVRCGTARRSISHSALEADNKTAHTTRNRRPRLQSTHSVKTVRHIGECGAETSLGIAVSFINMLHLGPKPFVKGSPTVCLAIEVLWNRARYVPRSRRRRCTTRIRFARFAKVRQTANLRVPFYERTQRCATTTARGISQVQPGSALTQQNSKQYWANTRPTWRRTAMAHNSSYTWQRLELSNVVSATFARQILL